VGLDGINLVANRPDLLDRSIILSLAPVLPENRQSEQTFWKNFNEARPRIFGGMLDILSGAMEILPDINLPSLPRLADFARWAVAAAEVMGHGAAAFLDAYAVNVIVLIQAVGVIAHRRSIFIDIAAVAQCIIRISRSIAVILIGEH
jgi:hypothetical protein